MAGWAARRLEPLVALFAFLVGAATLAYAAFGPTYISYSGSSCRIPPGSSCSISHSSSWTVNTAAVVLRFEVPVLIIFFLGACAAFAHYRFRSPVFLTALWTAAIVLLMASIVSGFSIGLLFLPGVALMFIAAIAGSWSRRFAPVWITAASFFALLIVYDTAMIARNIMRS